jgi:amino acid transporter
VSTPQLRRELGLADLVLFNVAAVVSVRWIAAAAHIGSGALTLWLLAVLLFFLPCALVVVELSTRFPAEGGYYVWTRQAFGERHAFVCGWMAWWSNLVFFPNVALAIAGMALHLWAGEHRGMTLALSLAVFWLPVATNLLGLRIGKWTPNAGGACTFLAGALLVACGGLVAWRQGPANPVALAVSWDFEKLNFWSQIALALVGIELGAVLSAEVRNPLRDLPRAALVSSFAIAGIFILGTAALLALVPAAEVHIVTGIVQGVEVAGGKLGAPWLGALMAALVTVGLLGNLGSWVAGAARLPFVIGLDRRLPAAFGRLHPRFRTPHVALLVQGLVGTVLLLLAQIGETARGAYLLLVDLTVVATMIPYLYLFAAALRLRRDPQRGRTPEHILTPGGAAGVVLAGGAGFATTLLAAALALVPPPGIHSVWLFELKTIGGTALALLVGMFFYLRRRA